MFLQTARYLIKAWNQALNGEKLPPTVAYLEIYAKNKRFKQQFDYSPLGILNAFQSATAKKIAEANNHLEARKKFLTLEESMNASGIELIKASELHCQAFLLQTAIEFFQDSAKTKLSSKLGSVLIDLLELYAVDLALRYLGSLLEVNVPS